MAKLKPIKQWLDELGADEVPEVNGKNFKESFRMARQLFGDDGYFTYKGKIYTTQYKEEVGESPKSSTKGNFQVLTPPVLEEMKNRNEIHMENTYEKTPNYPAPNFEGASPTNPNPFGGQDIDMPNEELTKELTELMGIDIPANVLAALLGGGIINTAMTSGVRGFGAGVKSGAGLAAKSGLTTAGKITNLKDKVAILENIMSKGTGDFNTVNNIFKYGKKEQELQKALEAVKRVVTYKF